MRKNIFDLFQNIILFYVPTIFIFLWYLQKDVIKFCILYVNIRKLI